MDQASQSPPTRCTPATRTSPRCCPCRSPNYRVGPRGQGAPYKLAADLTARISHTALPRAGRGTCSVRLNEQNKGLPLAVRLVVAHIPGHVMPEDRV